ncbi:MAG: hypothetical protein HC841_08050 [Verrucomicrobiae bacterium]|nr:hypothetical protein [Verrucomicrobiae bacterium]
MLMLGALGLLGCAAWRRRTASTGNGAGGR